MLGKTRYLTQRPVEAWRFFGIAVPTITATVWFLWAERVLSALWILRILLVKHPRDFLEILFPDTNPVREFQAGTGS